MLILFDIDATLLTSTRAGVRAIGLAGRELCGASFDEHRVDYSGRLDPLIIRDLLTLHGETADAAAIDRFRGRYRVHLEQLLVDPSLVQPCPGVMELLAALPPVRGVSLGLLTGNFPETGEMKLRAAGIDPGLFTVAAWGCDSPHDPPARDHLPPVALERFAVKHRRTIDPAKAVIIGDTPHDVSCARAHGLRSLAVATGMFTVDQLAEAGADRAVATVEDTQDIVRWLVGAAVEAA